jgi:hypothetical protein
VELVGGSTHPDWRELRAAETLAMICSLRVLMREANSRMSSVVTHVSLAPLFVLGLAA